MCIYRHIIVSYVVAVVCMLAAPALLHAEEELERGEERISAESVSAYTRAELSPAQRARMTGRSVYHDRNDGVVVVIDEEGNVARRIDAEDASIRVNEHTGAFLILSTPLMDEKATVKLFNRRGEIQMEIEGDIAAAQERVVGTLDNAVITSPFSKGPAFTEYKIFRYDQEGKQTLVEKPDNVLSDAHVYGNFIWTRTLTTNVLRKYDPVGNLLYGYRFPERAERGRRHFVSPDGRHLLTCYQPEDERHRRNFKLHIEGREAAEWQAGIPRPPIIFLNEEETVVYREWPQRGYPVAYTYDGRRRWSVRNEALSIAVHKIGHRFVVSSYELEDGVPQISHYSLEDGSKLGVTDLGGHVNLEGDALKRVPSRFHTNEAGNLIIPIADTYVTIRLNRMDQ